MKNRVKFILCAVMACLVFAGCKNENIEASDTGVTSSAAAYEPVILTRPEDGWSYNEVSQMLYIDGVNIPIPFTVENLGKEFSIKKSTTDKLGDEAYGTVLYKNNEPILRLSYYDIKKLEFKELKKIECYEFSTYYEVENNNYLNLNTSIVVNGVKLGDTLSKVNSIFGEPDNENKNGPIVIYQDKNTGKGCIGFWFDDSGNLYSITLIRH